AEDADREVCQRGRALFGWYLRASRSRRIVDKYPELIFRHAFVRTIFPDARFLIAIRSPWTTLASVAGWSDSHAVDGADWWGVRDQKWDILWTQGVLDRAANADLAAIDLSGESNHHVRAAVEWVVTMREALALADANRCARIVHYETLVGHPRETVRDTLRFCELPADARTEDYACATVTADAHNTNGKERVASLLPNVLTAAIEQTWSQFEVAEPAQ